MIRLYMTEKLKSVPHKKPASDDKIVKKLRDALDLVCKYKCKQVSISMLITMENGQSKYINDDA